LLSREVAFPPAIPPRDADRQPGRGARHVAQRDHRLIELEHDFLFRLHIDPAGKDAANLERPLGCSRKVCDAQHRDAKHAGDPS